MTRAQPELRWGEVCGYALAWFPAAALALWLKHIYLAAGSYLVISRFLGLSHSDELPLADRLTLFRSDLWLACVLAPLALAVVLITIPARIRPYLVALATSCACAYLFVHMVAIGNTGRLLSFELAVDAVKWGIDHPEDTSSYVSWSALVKLIVLIGSSATIAVTYRVCRARQCTFCSLLRRAAMAGLLGLVASAALVALAGHIRSIPTLPQHTSIAVLSADAFLDNEAPREIRRLQALDDAQLLDAMGEVTQKPDATDTRYFGNESQSDVLFFVLETGPARVTPPLGELEHLGSLADAMIIADEHYTTYPYTHDALFSLFGGQYPIERRVIRTTEGEMTTSLLWQLAKAGYVTARYTPSHDTFAEDTRMFRIFGLTDDHITSAEEIEAEAVIRKTVDFFAELPEHAFDSDAARYAAAARFARDTATLLRMKTDIARMKRNDRRFAAVFLPSLGHGPWIDYFGVGDDYPERGKRLVLMQDQWLGEIVEMLNENDWLEDTMIVVTADHGVRTREEDPDFPTGTIDAYSFHVPLYIFAPNTIRSPLHIAAVTSHVDVTPTVLDLLGIRRDTRFEQGNSLWHPGLSGRRTFFFAEGYLGADGFAENGTYYMLNYLSGATYRATALDFTSEHMLDANSPVHTYVRRTIERATLLNEVWVRRILDRERGEQGPSPPAIR